MMQGLKADQLPLLPLHSDWLCKRLYTCLGLRICVPGNWGEMDQGLVSKYGVKQDASVLRYRNMPVVRSFETTNNEHR